MRDLEVEMRPKKRNGLDKPKNSAIIGERLVKMHIAAEVGQHKRMIVHLDREFAIKTANEPQYFGVGTMQLLHFCRG